MKKYVIFAIAALSLVRPLKMLAAQKTSPSEESAITITYDTALNQDAREGNQVASSPFFLRPEVHLFGFVAGSALVFYFRQILNSFNP